MTDMEADKLSFLDENEPVEDLPVEEVAEEPVEEPVEEPEQAVEGEQDAEPPAAEPEPRQDHIPLTALLDEREKRQEAQRQLEALQRQIAMRQRPQEKPDFFDDPDRALRQAVEPVQVALTQQKLSQSRFLAEREFGKEMVERAYAYFDQHPAESQQLLNHPSPFHAAVEYFQQHDPQERERLFNEQVEARAKELAAQQFAPSKPKAPPPSMATARGVGKDAIQPGNAFDALFGD